MMVAQATGQKASSSKDRADIVQRWRSQPCTSGQSLERLRMTAAGNRWKSSQTIAELINLAAETIIQKVNRSPGLRSCTRLASARARAAMCMRGFFAGADAIRHADAFIEISGDGEIPHLLQSLRQCVRCAPDAPACTAPWRGPSDRPSQTTDRRESGDLLEFLAHQSR